MVIRSFFWFLQNLFHLLLPSDRLIDSIMDNGTNASHKEDKDYCCICCDVINNHIKLDACSHTFCRTCLINRLNVERKLYNQKSHPICHSRYSKFKFKKRICEHQIRNPSIFAYRCYIMMKTLSNSKIDKR